MLKHEGKKSTMSGLQIFKEQLVHHCFCQLGKLFFDFESMANPPKKGQKEGEEGEEEWLVCFRAL